MAMTFTETLGFLRKLGQYLTTNQAALQAKGLNVTSWITQVAALEQDMLTKDGEQEALRIQTKNKTAEVEAAKDVAYRTGSTWLDAIIAVVGKTTEEGKAVAKIRSEVRHGSNASAATPPAT